ncbi:RidA family protein, partial [Streptomyces asiaticus]
MAITLVNPSGLPEIDAYRQVSIATGSRLIHIAGQVAWDADGVTVGEGDLAAQVERCYLNIATALAEVGGSFDDVAKLTVYVVDWTPDKMPRFLEGAARAAAKLGVTPVPPGTLLGVQGTGRLDLVGHSFSSCPRSPGAAVSPKRSS